MSSKNLFFASLFDVLKEMHKEMRVSNKRYSVIKDLLISYFRSSNFTDHQGKGIEFGPFGTIRFPYRTMGAIDTSDLFGIDELIIFSYYLSNAAIYRKTLDLGANLGLHSIMMSRCGFNVTAFEPDPIHQEILLANLSLNDIHNVTLQRAAISDKDGIAEFIRVRGNTTGSHLAGAKSNPYGDLDRFEVEVKAIGPFATKVDFAKMDVEGHEINVINGIQQETWDRLDILMECGSFDNACSLFDLSRSLNIKLYSQKIGWDCVNAVSDLPTSHHEGSVILTRKERLNW